MANFRDSFLHALYDAPFRSKFIEGLEVVVIWQGPDADRYIVNFNSTKTLPVKRVVIMAEHKLLVVGETSSTILPLVLVDNITDYLIYCLDSSVLSLWASTHSKLTRYGTFIDFQKVRFNKIVDGKRMYYDKWFNVVESEPIHFILPRDIDYDSIIEFTTSDMLQVIRGITMYWLTYAILPEWRAIGEYPYHIEMKGQKYIVMKYFDIDNEHRVCLTNEHECIEFADVAKCEQVDGLYNGYVLSKINHKNITIQIGDVFLERHNYCFVVSNASNPKSGNHTKGAAE